MPFRFIRRVVDAWWSDVWCLHRTLIAQTPVENRPRSEARPEVTDQQPDTGTPKSPRKIRPIALLDHFGLAARVEPETIMEHEMEIMRKTWPDQEISYTRHEFANPLDAINSLRPFVATLPLKYLFLKGRNGAYCILTNGYPNPMPSVSATAKLCGFDALDVVYEADPWHYFVGAYTSDAHERHIASSARAADVNFFQTPTPYGFEDSEAIKKLKKGTPIGRGEIAKFCELFGWPLPMSREGLEFITESTIYELPPMRPTTWAGGTTYATEDEERAITLIPPSWMGEEVDVMAAPAENPGVAQREAVRRKWMKFRKAFRAELKERLGSVRCVLVLPSDGMERHDSWIDVIAPDDGCLLDGFENRAVNDAVREGSFFVEAEVQGIDEHRDVYVVLEMKAKTVEQKDERRITYAPNADVPVPAYEGEGEHRALFDVKATYEG